MWVEKYIWMGIRGSLVVGVGLLVVRVRDEERMLRGSFGKEWEVWHTKTGRFIPGVF
jgi:protein-S-isoprenylcysteine O-methyltransferase Ste14